MGRISKGVKCDVEGCEKQAVRSLSIDAIEVLSKAGLKIKTSQRRIYLCEDHYKLYKKLKRKEARLEKWRLTR